MGPFSVILLLVTAGFALAPSAAADDVEECTQLSEEGGELCVYDSSDGDREEACDKEDGSGSYEGKTAVEASTGDESPRAQAAAGGEEECEHGTDYFGNPTYDESEQAFVESEVCLEGSFICSLGAEAEAVWDEDGIDAAFAEGVTVATPAGELDVDAEWAEGYDGDDRAIADVNYCVSATSFGCDSDGGVDATWDDETVEGEVSVCLESGWIFCTTGAEAWLFWGEDWGTDGCEHQAGVWYTLDEEEISEECITAPPEAPGAPGAPSPGWGQLTPDTGE
jgi:hypothetical protein